MIAYIEGNLTFKSPAYIIIEANGIGYHVNISLNTYEVIQDKKSYKVLTHLHVKEDAHTLYGFAEESEKVLFSQLISVSGVGPNTARMVLSSLPPEEIKQAIVQENVAVIQSIKGIGPKSAKRLILELKDKVLQGQENISTNTSNSHNTFKDEALSALVMLGFSKPAAEKSIQKALQSTTTDITVEELIKLALKNM